jgi:hypothetical protein
MKNTVIKLSMIVCFILLPLLSVNVFSQSPPYPPNFHGSAYNPPPPAGGSPLDGGISMLLILGAAYGGRKIKLLSKKN